MLEKIGDLPAHPLIVHLPIILGPVVGLLTLLCLVPKWREKLLWPTAGLAIVFAISTIVATESGENLAATLQIGDGIKEHQEAGEQLRMIAIILAIVITAVALLGKRLTGVVGTIAAVIVAALGVLTIGSTVKTGHAGAKAVWKAPFEAAQEAEQQSGEDSP